MDSIYINNHLKEWIQEEFADSFKEKSSNWKGRGNNWWSRCLVLKSALSQERDPSTRVRYVLLYDHPKDNSWPAYIELQILEPQSSSEDDFSDLAAHLKEHFPSNSDYIWASPRRCRNKQMICGWDDAKSVFSQMQERFNPVIQKYFQVEQENGELAKMDVPLRDNNQEVELYTLTLLQLLNLNLRIPDYQRIYCWDEKTIRVLWDDVQNLDKEEKYRLGTIILQRVDDTFQIIDGQQRLVTLSLMLSTLHIQAIQKGISLLKETYQSKLAEDYIAYNKFLIRNFLSGVKRSERRTTAERLWNGIEFNVLILNDSSIDLAYTFFSNENSRGKALSDFDLLKAHHLRFITDSPEQSMHLAKKWDKMILAGDEADGESERAYVRSLSLYVFRLRHWIRMQHWDDNAKYNVKREYEAAPSIREIPPFGEQFYWNESIQGGSHFFAYVETILSRFNSFASTNAYNAIHRLDMETHKWYRDVIESLLFSYYLKFGNQYLAEALMLIAKRVSVHRYANSRVNLGKLQQYGADTNIVMMIDRATSPTFFLGELCQAIKEMPALEPQTKIQQRYLQEMSRCFELCKQDVEIPSITQLVVK